MLSLLIACVDINTLQRDMAEAERITAEAAAMNARQCTPREMAMAESNLEFTRLEFEQGDPRRAREHLDVAAQNARVALETAPSCLPKDRDNDGFVDEKDLCPDEAGVAPEGCPILDSDKDGLNDPVDECPKKPEDLDGFKDADGCPEDDNDQDGVADTQDACPMEAEDRDRHRDEDGCPDIDNDQDGFLDPQDNCPDTPGPNQGCPNLDTDGDGFLDGNDACPREYGVPPDGCPIRDADRDGFVDAVDQCPLQPETMNQYIDEDGCPDVKPEKVKIANRQIVIEEQIKFETGKAIIKPESYAILDSVVQVMRDYPALTIRIEGHTDSDGNDAANLSLSKARADAVFEYMLAKGVEARRMETVGYGETRPIDTNKTAQGKANNRRVEFHITSTMPGQEPAAPAAPAAPAQPAIQVVPVPAQPAPQPSPNPW